MKTLYIDCNAGAAGDMLMSALFELYPDKDGFLKRLNLLLPGVCVTAEKAEQNGIVGTHIRVKVNGREESEDMHEHHEHHEHHDHPHNSIKDINALICGLDVSEKVKNDALAVYKLLAEAEARVHGCSPENIHFHEVGTLDAVTDILGVSMLIEGLGVNNIYASPVNVGGGTVKCAHGILPVPAPAAAALLENIPFYGGGNEGERCTPTGAALLKHFVKAFGDMPVIKAEKIGMGVGTKHFSSANILRIFMGDTAEQAEEVYEICCNIDDMTGEDIAFACDMIFAAGAKDVFVTPVCMKKGRPSQLLTCIAAETEREGVIKSIFKHTSTIGIREHKCKRYLLERSEENIDTQYGKIRVKTSKGFGVKKVKPEFEDIKKAALEFGLSAEEIRKRLNK